jgi:hypothetical protein
MRCTRARKRPGTRSRSNPAFHTAPLPRVYLGMEGVVSVISARRDSDSNMPQIFYFSADATNGIRGFHASIVRVWRSARRNPLGISSRRRSWSSVECRSAKRLARIVPGGRHGPATSTTPVEIQPPAAKDPEAQAEPGNGAGNEPAGDGAQQEAEKSRSDPPPAETDAAARQPHGHHYS